MSDLTGSCWPRLAEYDPEVASIIENEMVREEGKINLIASENYTSPAVMEAQGSVLTNKYAEGYPGKRYYSGCEMADSAEQLAIDRAIELFGAEYANVQPHSGAQANMAVYFSILKPGDRLMAMDLACGGHLTHGSPANFSGKLYEVIPYGVDRESEVIDYDAVARLAEETRPAIIVAGASSYPRAIDFGLFREIADSVGAPLMVDMAHFGGLVVGKAHPDPVEVADYVTCTTHKTLRGPRGGFILAREEYGRKLNSAVFPGMQGGPLVHTIAAKAVCFKEALDPSFAEYAHRIVRNASVLCAKMVSEGFRIVSGGTDNHLFMIDLRPQGITGMEAQNLLESVGITVNRNAIPYDPEPPMVTSGIRIGTPSVTTRGMNEEQMELLGELISRALKNIGNEGVLNGVSEKTKTLAAEFPVYR